MVVVSLLQLLLDRALLRIRFRKLPSIRLEFLPDRRIPRGDSCDLHPSVRPGTGSANLPIKMIPDTESVCQSSEAAVRSTEVYHEEKIRNGPEREAASVTAWKRYQQLVATMESRGGKFNRKSMIEAIFRGSDLVYASH